MAEFSFPVPGDGTTAFVTEKVACDFLGDISDDGLDRAAERLPWLNRRRIGKNVVYDPEEIGLLAYLLKKNIVDHEIFSRSQDRPESPSVAPERPRAPGKKDANPGAGQG